MPPSQLRRRKVVVLTPQGFQKLQAATSNVEDWNCYAKSCSLEALSERTGLSTHTLSKVHAMESGVDRRTLVRYFSAFSLALESNDYVPFIRNHDASELVFAPSLPDAEAIRSSMSDPILSWGTAPDVSIFYGRHAEVETLSRCLFDQRCRLVTLIGQRGIGKTWLATKLAEEVQHEFQAVIWRSLRPLSRSHPSVSLSDLIDDLIQQLTPQTDLKLSETISGKILYLLDCLRQRRCLIILDDLDSILQRIIPSTTSEISADDMYRSSYEEYDELLKHIGQGRHQSCLMLLSREEPRRMQHLSGDHSSVRLFELKGLQVEEVVQLFSTKGYFQGTPAEWQQLVSYYGGNPAILKMVATTIQRLFEGSIGEFLREKALICHDIRELLEQQLSHLSSPEQTVLSVLATQKSTLAFLDLRSHISPKISTSTLLEALKSLEARSLVKKANTCFLLPPLIRDYVREHLAPPGSIEMATPPVWRSPMSLRYSAPDLLAYGI